MLLSIIIPIYNVEKYIAKTLESIFLQNIDFNQIEIILVNDGTPDRSMMIAQQWIYNYPQIKVINQSNQGLSCARNSGLKIANGEYIWFVDSDDTLVDNSIEKVISCINNTTADIIGFDMICVDETSKYEYIQSIAIKNKKNYNRYYTWHSILGKTHNAPVQRFLYKHSFLKNNNLFFYPNILHEDQEFNIRAFFLAKSIILKPFSTYRYLLRSSGSIMSTPNLHSVKSKMIIIDSLQKFKQDKTHSKKEMRYIDYHIFFFVISILTTKIDDKVFNNYSRKYYNLYRKYAIKGLIANMHLFYIKKLLKAMCVCISPTLFRKIFK